MSDTHIKIGTVELPNPVGYLLNFLFPKRTTVPANGNATPDTSSVDPDIGISQEQITAAAKEADEAFAAILVIAGSTAVGATGPGGAPFVATASAAVGSYWASLPAKEKACIWIKGGPISQFAGQAVENKANSVSAAQSAAANGKQGGRSGSPISVGPTGGITA